MTRLLAGSLACLLILTGASITRAESPAVLLQKGIQAEQSAGNLDEAIKIYQQIIKEAKANREYIAQAQFRLGMCLMKARREAEATAAFEKLMTDFPEQKDLIAQARKQMPSPAFPDIVGCRLRETISLRLGPPKPDWKEATPARAFTVYAYSILEIKWDLDPALAKKTSVVEIDVEGLGSTNTNAESRSVQVGWSEPGPEPGSTGTWGLTAGEHTIRVVAYQGTKDNDHVIAVATAKLTVEPLPNTQINIDDIRRDGSIEFRFVGQDMNDGVRAVSTRNFSNSDFVNVTGMSDDQGRPLKFTVKHDRRMFRYAVTLNTQVPPGQPILMSNEGTETGLIQPVPGKTDEFRYYMKHWPSTGEPTRRIEIYRLPKGAELLETLPRDMAHRIENGRVELFVEKMIPPGGSITTSFRYRLPGGTVASQPVTVTQESAGLLKLNPAPWSDGEVMRLRIDSAAGAEIGTIIYTAAAIKVAGKDAWRIESYMVIPMTNMEQFTRVDAERDSFAPIDSRTYNTMLGDYRAQFGTGKVKLSIGSKSEKSSREVDLEQVAFDNEQALYVIRRMPLADGYHGSFPIFPVVQGGVMEATVQVTGKEKASVPAGTYDCYKVTLKVNNAGSPLLEHKLWLSADKHQYLVKYDSGTAIMVLDKVSIADPKSPAIFENKELGLRLTAPAGWHFYTNPSLMGYKMSTYLLSPEMQVWALLTVATTESVFATPREAADGDVEVLKGFFKGYTVRPGSWADLKVAGLPATRYVADYEDEGKAMVEYRTYILGKPLLYWFVFRVEKDRFDACRHQLDAIVDGFSVSGKAEPERPETRPAGGGRRRM
jgi:hypothetical protein